MVSVTVTGESTFFAGEPEVLFTGGFFDGGSPVWDISSDGQQFLMMKLAEQPEQRFEDSQLIVVENWLEELKRLAPTAE